MFLLPHGVSVESHLKAFQYKALNSILFANRKLCKIYISDDKCSFYKLETETLHHVFFHCKPCSMLLEGFWVFLNYIMTKEFVHLTIQDIVGILMQNAPYLTTYHLWPNYIYGNAEEIRYILPWLQLKLRSELNMKGRSLYQSKRAPWIILIWIGLYALVLYLYRSVE